MAVGPDSKPHPLWRNTGNPFSGPFEITQGGKQLIKVWPKP
jgi:hypothetical protein